MRLPQKPPRLELDLLASASPDYEALWLKVPGPLVNGKYLHWDELRHRKPPNGLSHKHWWTLLKMRRDAAYFRLPIQDKSGHPFVCANVETVVRMLHEVDLAVGGHVGIADPIVNVQTRDRYYISSLMEEAVTSSQLEGAQTTRQRGRDLLRSGQKPRNRSERMILNNYRTMIRVRELAEAPLSPETILALHKDVTSGTLENPDAAGRLRNESERDIVVASEDTILHSPPEPAELPSRLETLCQFANGLTPDGFLHPVLRSIVVHFWLAYDHPFVDGNGRTARALFYWSMLHHRYWLFDFVSISPILLRAPTQYAKAFLHTESDQNDLTYFVDYQLGVILRGIADLREYVACKTEEIGRLERNLKAMRSLNPRQRAIISHALRHPFHTYTIESHRASHQVTYATSRADLLSLHEHGFLEADKVGKTWEFRPVPNLENRLAKSD